MLVSSVEGLVATLEDPSATEIVIAASGSPYLLALSTVRPYDAQVALVVNWNVSIRAEVPGQVILDAIGERRLAQVTSQAQSVQLHGLTLHHGYGSSSNGGALYVHEGVDLAVFECSIIENTAIKGAALYIMQRAIARIIRCDIKHNEGTAVADMAGGALTVSPDAELIIQGCNISFNKARGNGGALSASTHVSTAPQRWTFINSTFIGNVGLYDVSGLYFRSENLVVLVINCVFLLHQGTTIMGQSESLGDESRMIGNTFEGNRYNTAFRKMSWVCDPGRWMPDSGTTEGDFHGCARNCYAGFYGLPGVQTTAECSGRCWEGHHCPEASAKPVPCPSGHYLPVTGSQSNLSCIPCFPGTFGADTGRRNRCEPCPPGSFAAELASTQCAACPKGGYCAATGASSSSMAFTPCSPGTYNPLEGSSDPSACQPCKPQHSNSRARPSRKLAPLSRFVPACATAQVPARDGKQCKGQQ